MFGFMKRSKAEDEAWKEGYAEEFEKQWNALESLYHEHTQALEEHLALCDEVITKALEVIDRQKELIKLLQSQNEKLIKDQ